MDTRSVCSNFFAVVGEEGWLGNGVVPAIHCLTAKKKAEDPFFFSLMENRITRGGNRCSTIQQFKNLLTANLEDISLNNIDLQNTANWTTIAYMFYSCEMVDSIAHDKLNREDYELFRKDIVVMLSDELEKLFGSNLSPLSWKIFQFGHQLEIMRKPCCNKPSWLQIVLCLSAGFLLAQKCA